MPGKNFFIPTSRIEQFSDGVLAIVITLLVLELRVPHFKEGASLKEDWIQLVKVGPKFISFVLSFFFIAIFWVNHHQMYHSIKEADRKLLWYNIHLLFWLTIIPFPTAMIGDHPESPLAVMCLAFVLLMASFASFLMRRYAHFNADLMHENLSKESKEGGVQKNVIGIILYFLAIVLAYFSVYISYAIFVLVLGMFFIPPELEKKSKSSST